MKTSKRLTFCLALCLLYHIAGVRNVAAQNAHPATSLIVNEVQVANIDMFLDPSFNYGAWIELYNTSFEEVALAGLYITDDEANLRKYRLTNEAGVVPERGYKVLWFDHFGIWNLGEHTQIPFKLNMEGGTIMLTDGDHVLVRQDYPAAVARTSYARIKGDAVEWGITAEPTPGKSNAKSTFATEQLAPPLVSHDSQLFTGTLSVRVVVPTGATLYYTTDGSTPTPTNGTSGTTGTRLSVKATTTYRFRLYKEGKLPSDVVTRTYILKDKDFTLPIIAVSGSPADLFGADYGVFTRGNGNGRSGLGQTSACNWNMEWDRPVNFEYFAADASGADPQVRFSQEVDLARCGGWSRAWKPYSFKLKAAKQYGSNTMNYAFFPRKPYIKNRTLQIRNGGNDNSCRIKDPALQEIVSRSGLDVEGQQWVPVMHYINGEYRGVINMREPNNKHYVVANYGLDVDEMDQFEINPDSNYLQMAGTREAWDQLYNLSAGAADSATFEQISQLLDIDEYINYMAVELYLGSTDWPQNNVKGFRRADNGKFRMVLFDLDHSFNSTGEAFNTFKNKKTVTFTDLHGKYWDGTSIEGRRVKGELQFVTIFLNLIKNKRFSKMFLDRFCVIAGSVFMPQRCKDIINEMAKTVEGPMKYKSAYSSSESPWNTANSLINSLSASRISTMTYSAASFVSEKARRQRVRIFSNTPEARFEVNDFKVPTGQLDTYLYGPITLKALPLPGYKFCFWKKGIDMTADPSDETDLVTTDMAYLFPETGSVYLTAVYAPLTPEELAAGAVPPVRINEVSAGNSMFINDYFKKDDWIELYNTTSQPIDVAGMYLTDNPDNPMKFQIPSAADCQTLIPPHGHLIVWASKRDVIGAQLHANFKLANADGEAVMLTSQDGSWSDLFVYDTHADDESVGRYPDGGDDVYRMSRPTICRDNLLTSYTQYLYARASDADAVADLAATSATVVSATYYALDGLCVGSSKQSLRPGIYVERQTMSDGTTRTQKIIIR